MVNRWSLKGLALSLGHTVWYKWAKKRTADWCPVLYSALGINLIYLTSLGTCTYHDNFLFQFNSQKLLMIGANIVFFCLHLLHLHWEHGWCNIQNLATSVTDGRAALTGHMGTVHHWDHTLVVKKRSLCSMGCSCTEKYLMPAPHKDTLVIPPRFMSYWVT